MTKPVGGRPGEGFLQCGKLKRIVTSLSRPNPTRFCNQAEDLRETVTFHSSRLGGETFGASPRPPEAYCLQCFANARHNLLHVPGCI
jgi:hypothetical protein